LTNTPPKVSQRAPGGMQGVGIMEPIISKAARKLGLDQVEVRKINAPAGKAPFGPALPNGKQAYVTSAFVKEALDRGSEVFKWEEKKASSSGKRIRLIELRIAECTACPAQARQTESGAQDRAALPRRRSCHRMNATWARSTRSFTYHIAAGLQRALLASKCKRRADKLSGGHAFGADWVRDVRETRTRGVRWRRRGPPRRAGRPRAARRGGRVLAARRRRTAC